MKQLPSLTHSCSAFLCLPSCHHSSPHPSSLCFTLPCCLTPHFFVHCLSLSFPCFLPNYAPRFSPHLRILLHRFPASSTRFVIHLLSIVLHLVPASSFCLIMPLPHLFHPDIYLKRSTCFFLSLPSHPNHTSALCCHFSLLLYFTCLSSCHPPASLSVILSDCQPLHLPSCPLACLPACLAFPHAVPSPHLQ